MLRQLLNPGQQRRLHGGQKLRRVVLVRRHVTRRRRLRIILRDRQRDRRDARQMLVGQPARQLDRLRARLLVRVEGYLETLVESRYFTLQNVWDVACWLFYFLAFQRRDESVTFRVGW